MKRHKAPGMSGLVAEMILQKKVASQRTRSQVWNYQLTKERGIQWGVDLTEELNCWNML